MYIYIYVYMGVTNNTSQIRFDESVRINLTRARCPEFVMAARAPLAEPQRCGAD